MTPSLAPAVSTGASKTPCSQAPSSRVYEPAVSTEPDCVAKTENEKLRIPGDFYGRYWARTSDPQLVEPVGRYADVRACSRVSPPLQVFSRVSTPRFRPRLRPLAPPRLSTS